jgi:hypothetical protein
MHKLASKFIKPEIKQKQKQKLENKSSADLDVSLENQKDDEFENRSTYTEHT